MSITVTAEQGNALCDQILDRLSGIGDIWLAVREGNYDDARRLWRQYSDDLTLLADLGWGEGTGEAVELTTPPKVLRRALSYHCHRALMLDASEVPRRAELRECKERNGLVVQVCRRLLAELDRSIRAPG